MSGVSVSGASRKSSLSVERVETVKRAVAAWEVIEESLSLVAHLENDLQTTSSQITTEQGRIELMNQRLDELAEMRLLELPDAVQKGILLNL